MEYLITPLSIVFALGIIIFVHELGHHVVAKAFGVKVLTFSLGFGKRLWGFERGGTDYRVSLIPLGGYVRLGGELPEESTGDPDEFLSKPRWQRILVYLAGPAMNVVLSVALIAGLFMYGISIQALQESPPVIGWVEEGSAGAEVGLKPGDLIKTIDGEKVSKWPEVQFIIATSPERPLRLEVERGDETFQVVLTPRKLPRYEFGDAGLGPRFSLQVLTVFEDSPAARAGLLAGDEIATINAQAVTAIEELVTQIQEHAGEPIEIEVLREGQKRTLTAIPETGEDGKGRIGIEFGFYRKLPFGEAIVESFRYNVETIQQSLVVIGKLFTGELSAKSSLSGPIEIAKITSRAAQRGFRPFFLTIAFISVSIAFMNLLPIPVLDGGHITILLVESVIRRDLSMVFKMRLIQAGFMVLMTLMAMVIYFDIAKSLQ